MTRVVGHNRLRKAFSMSTRNAEGPAHRAGPCHHVILHDELANNHIDSHALKEFHIQCHIDARGDWHAIFHCRSERHIRTVWKARLRRAGPCAPFESLTISGAGNLNCEGEGGGKCCWAVADRNDRAMVDENKNLQLKQVFIGNEQEYHKFSNRGCDEPARGTIAKRRNRRKRYRRGLSATSRLIRRESPSQPM
jgi:hypothetical protein